MLKNNLDPEVAERPDDLVVYGGTGRAARSLGRLRRDRAARSRTLDDDETMLVQSGKPVGVFRTHEWAPRVLIANSNLVPEWANWDEFRRLEALGLTMYGQMTAGSWIYIGTQGILQGTYECFAEIARRRFGGIARRHDHAHRRPRRHGRRAAAGGHDERRRRAVHRGRPAPHPSAGSRPATSTRWPTTSTTRSPAASAAEGERPAAVASASSATPPRCCRELLEHGLRRRHRHRPDQRPRPAQLRARPTSRREATAELRARRTRRATSAAAAASMAAHCAAMVGFLDAGAEVFDYGNSLRAEAKLGGFERAFDYPGFVPAYIRPLFCEGKGPFRWVALSGDPADIAATDRAVLEEFPDDEALRPLDPAGRRAGRLPGPAGADLLARLRRAPPARPALQRDGAQRAS